MTLSSISTRNVACFLVAALAMAGCASDTTSGENTGSLSLSLELADGIVINSVGWTITGGEMDPMSGTIDTSAPGATASVEVYGLPPTIGPDYTIVMEAEAEDGTECKGAEDFGVDVGEATEIMVFLNCKRPERLGGVRVNGEFNMCAELVKAVVSPLETSVGNDIDLSAQGEDAEDDAITYTWSGDGGSFDDANAASTTYTCEEVGDHDITISVTDNDEYCDMATWTVPVTCVDGDGFECVEDDDCGPGEACLDNECVPDPDLCTEDEDCGPGQVCLDNMCVPDPDLCTGDEDCGPDEVCLDNMCVPDPNLCIEDDDCGPGEACLDNECVPDPNLCTGDEDCGPGQVCLDNMCVPDPNLCTGDEQCEIGEICLDNMCVADPDFCVEDSECMDGEVCEDNECVTAPLDCEYIQDFESLDQESATALGDDGWTVFGNVFSPDGAYLYGYGPNPAPNNSGGFSGIALGQGGPSQGDQQLVIISDYNNADQNVGNRIEANTFRERAITMDDVGKTLNFSFDAKRGNINDPADDGCTMTANPPCDSTANAFIKTLDPGAGFATTNFIPLDTTNLPEDWGRYSIELKIDAGLVGQLLQVGFSATASNFEPSGNFYDNVDVCFSEDNGGGGGDELTTNGDFETGDLSGWTLFCDGPNAGSCAASSAESNGGTYSGNLVASVPEGGGPPSFPLMKQANMGIGNVGPSSPVTVRFDLFGSLTGPGGVVFAEFFSELDGGGTSKSEILGGGPLFPMGSNDWTAGWVSYEFLVTTGADVSGGVTLQLKADCGANPGCTVDTYFDNVSVSLPELP